MYKLLIADDEYFVRYGLEHIVPWEEYGIEICGSVANGLEALEVFHRERPDIILTDVKMPEMNGLELLRVIRQVNPTVKIIVISGFNDFDYVKETLVYGVENYILKPIDEDELSETLLNATDKIENESRNNVTASVQKNYIIENVFNRLITNSIALKEVEERFDYFDIDMTGDAYLLGLIRMTGETGQETEERKRALIGQLKSTLKGFKTHIFYNLTGDIVILFCLGIEDSYESVEEVSKDIIHNLNRDEGIDVFVTLGSLETGMDQIHVSYECALSLQEYIFIYDKNTRISHRRVSSRKEALGDLFEISISDFRQRLSEGNRHEVELFFAQLKQSVLSSKDKDLNYIRSFLIELVAVLINIIKEKQLWQDRDVIYPDKLYEKLFGESNIRISVNWMKDISIKIVESVVEEQSKPATIHEQVLAYINDHYNHDISLKIIAAEFYVNSSYLGQLFKKETGKLFSTYLNEFRIEKAKAMMTGTNMKASHIAAEVGYSDPNYFYKVFKKYTGIYPSEYQR